MTATGPADTTTPRSGGMPVVGVVLVVLLLTGLGAAVDLVLSGSLGWGVAVGFVLGSAVGASRVRRSDLLAGAVVPPIVFALVVLVAIMLKGDVGSIMRVGLGVATELALLAPGLWLGTVIAVVITLVRRSREPRVP